MVCLLELVREDEALRVELARFTAVEDLEAAIAPLGFTLRQLSVPDELTDADLDGISSEATDRTCHGTTDCCQTKRTCFGTTDCCR